MSVPLAGLGSVQLAERLSQHGETAVFRTSHPGVVIKVFDLECGKPDEVSYAPYAAYNLEKDNFEALNQIEHLRRFLPTFHGCNIDYQSKYAYIAMEFLQGQNLVEWSRAAASRSESAQDWTEHFREAIYETLGIVTHFHNHGIVLIDFKPDNVIRLTDRRIKFVDLGAFLIPGEDQDQEKFVYSATPDYAELVIDTSNMETGIPVNETSDIFAAGVAIFEISTGESRIRIPLDLAEKLMKMPEIYRFRDSQIRDVWHEYPHLQDLLPLVESQLTEGMVLFSELWFLIKGLLSRELLEWEEMSEEEHRQLILSRGAALIASQMPAELAWLAEPIAQATTLRSLRLESVADLMRLLSQPVSEEVRNDILAHNGLILFARDMGHSVDFVQDLNAWEVRWDDQNSHWAIRIPVAVFQLGELAPVTFLKQGRQDSEGHHFYQIVTDNEADRVDGKPLTLSQLSEDHFSWLGT